MSGPQATTTECGQCGQPHPARIASDGGRTYRAADGHAWRAAEPTTHERLTRPHNERYDVLFGLWAACRRCGLLASNTDAGMASHDATHAELDRLRAEVARLARIVGGGANGGGEAA